MRAPRRGAPRLFASLRGLGPARWPGEVLAALVLLAIAVPEQMATARLLGMPPLAGLVSFAAGSLAFAALGRAPRLSVGADSTIAPIIAATLVTLAAPGSPAYATLVALNAALVGALLLLARPLRLDRVADLLSVPVATGFLAGIAVHVIGGALPEVLGLSPEAQGLPQRLAEMALALPEADPRTTAIGLGVAAVGLIATRIGRRVPGPLIALAAAAGAVRLWHLPVPMLAPLPAGLPGPGLALLPYADLAAAVPLAGMVVLLILIQTAAVRQQDGVEDDAPAPDLVAIGAGAVLSGLAGGFAVNASPPRTAALIEAGAHSQAAGLLAVAVTLALAVFAGGLTALLPQAALGGVLLMVGVHLIRLGDLRRIARQSPAELALALAAAGLVILLPVSQSVWLAVLMSLAHALYTIARPGAGPMARVPGTTVWWTQAPGAAGETVPGVLVFAVAAPLTFLNARVIGARLRAEAATVPGLRRVVIEATGVIGVDVTGARVFAETLAGLRAHGIELALARLENDRAAAEATRTGLIAAFGAGHVFRSVEEAVQARFSPPPPVQRPGP